MESTFSITFSFKTSLGFECFANFSIGHHRKKAYDIFQQLKGETDIAEKDVLFIEFIETTKGLPINLKIISCTLDQLAENCKIITKELFKLKNIDISR